MPTKYMAFNPLTGELEQVFSEDEIGADEMVIPFFWCASADRYVTVPGTEIYGYVPQEVQS